MQYVNLVTIDFYSMKKPKDHIFKLIHSMSPTEKRYFKRHYAANENSLTQLFDFINGMKKYDEQLVKDHFSNSKISKNLKVLKVQLLQLILKSLSSYYSKKQPKSIIRSGLEEIDLLMEKQLYDLASDRLVKIKNICLEHEEFVYLIEIAYKEFRLQHVSHDNIGISRHPIIQDLQAYLAHLDTQFKLTKMGHDLIDRKKSDYFKTQSQEEKAYFEQLLQEELLNTPNQSLSFRAKLSRNIVLGTIYGFLDQKDKIAILYKENIQLFNKHPIFKSGMAFEYMAVLRNYMNFLLEERTYTEIAQLVAEAKFYAGENTLTKRQLAYFYYGQLKAQYEQHLFTKNTGTLENQVNDLLAEHDIAGERIALLIYCYLALSYLAQEKYHKVQYYIRNMHQAEAKSKAYFEEFINILEFINHYEAGDEGIAENLLLSILRKIKAEKSAISPCYEEILTFFNQLLKHPNQKVLLANQLSESLQQFTDDKIYYLFQYFELNNWLQALSLRKKLSNHLSQLASQIFSK